MKSPLLAAVVFLLGCAVGSGLVALFAEDPDVRAVRDRVAPGGVPAITLRQAEDAETIRGLRAELEKLRASLAEGVQAAPNPYPNDSLDSIELLMQNAFADNNVDWLLEVIERLLLMGEDGYPMLRRLIEDIAFKGKFLPGQNEFRIDQLYTVGKIFTKHEREFIGFLNYLLVDNRTVPMMRQGAMMGAAFYVGSKAPGSEDLRETLIRQFLEEQGGMPGLPLMPAKVQERMQVVAMAMTGDKAAVPALRDKLRTTKDDQMKSDIIGALAYLGDESVLPDIQERLDPQAGDFRKEIDALARLDSPESHETAAQFLKSIPNSKSFFSHASRYVRAGGGTAGVQMIKERIEANPKDPEIAGAIGTLQRYPTKESLETLNLISQSAEDDKVKERAAKAAESVQQRLDGSLMGEMK